MGDATKMSFVERGTIYTLGYFAWDATAQLERSMCQAHTLLVDVRLRPASRWSHQWNKAALTSRYGERCHWEPRLGNLHYKSRNLPIALAPGHEDAIAEKEERESVCMPPHFTSACVQLR